MRKNNNVVRTPSDNKYAGKTTRDCQFASAISGRVRKSKEFSTTIHVRDVLNPHSYVAKKNPDCPTASPSIFLVPPLIVNQDFSFCLRSLQCVTAA
jgi:hypothetical protein